MTRSRLPHHVRRATAAVTLAVLAFGLSPSGGPSASAEPGVAERPTAVVAMGDSAISGEGAGDYEPGTDGPADFCHRSAHAQIHATSIPGIDQTVNLACSGAATANVRIGGAVHYTEPSQGDQLRAVARDLDVEMIVLEIGANDDPAFAEVVLECITAWLNILSPGCAQTVGEQWPARVAAMAPKVEAVIADIRTVMREAGYADDDYDLVLESYASPVTENMNPLIHAVQGCPMRLADARWARTEAAPQLSAGLRGVAERTGVRFLDLSRATEGHEACTRTGAPRWQNPIVIDPTKLPQGLNLHVVQQSFHPNAAGHAQLGRCLGEFAETDAPAAACLSGADGNLHARPLTEAG